jgi:hypothetical protein
MYDDDQEPPDPRAIEELLAERYPIPPKVRLAVGADLHQGRPRLVVSLERVRAAGPERIRLEVLHQQGGDSRWDATLDAFDALVGTLLEGDFAYRDLPTGDGVVHGDATFTVHVEAERPDLDRAADRLLGEGGGEEPS